MPVQPVARNITTRSSTRSRSRGRASRSHITERARNASQGCARLPEPSGISATPRASVGNLRTPSRQETRNSIRTSTPICRSTPGRQSVSSGQKVQRALFSRLPDSASSKLTAAPKKKITPRVGREAKKEEKPKVESPKECRNLSHREKLECPICWDNEDAIKNTGKLLVATFCGHIFCDSCIQAIVRHDHKCPMCRSKLNLKDFHPLFA